MLARVLEPEVMATHEEALAYDAMDHAQVNVAFVDGLLAAAGAESLAGEILDLGTGPALIPVELCRRDEQTRVVAADLSTAMLDMARLHVEMESLTDRILLTHIDAKALPFEADRFTCVMSNSIVHHIPEPSRVLQEAWRVLAPGGLAFFRDLLRPSDDETVRRLVQTYTGEETEYQQKMFDDSLRAALTIDEMRELVAGLGASPETVGQTTDRHWTWAARK